ncbi:hypothetical protein H4582DRAFT_2058189 [Lactarius indigo]|nr:hypothetical protein H4582DRAFT_2058189 [Lactarius indigo]
MSTQECRCEVFQPNIAWVSVIAAGPKAEREIKPWTIGQVTRQGGGRFNLLANVSDLIFYTVVVRTDFTYLSGLADIFVDLQFNEEQGHSLRGSTISASSFIALWGIPGTNWGHSGPQQRGWRAEFPLQKLNPEPAVGSNSNSSSLSFERLLDLFSQRDVRLSRDLSCGRPPTTSGSDEWSPIRQWVAKWRAIVFGSEVILPGVTAQEDVVGGSTGTVLGEWVLGIALRCWVPRSSLFDRDSESDPIGARNHSLVLAAIATDRQGRLVKKEQRGPY